MFLVLFLLFCFFSSRRRHTRGALVTGVQTCALPIFLCITFTKAGAAEMAHRIHERLAMWVRMDDGDLRTELQALGLALDLIGYDRGVPALMQRARSLFATVIDSPAGDRKSVV